MARYIKIIDDITAVDPTTDEPLPDRIPFSAACRTLFSDPRLTQALDVFSLIDLRKKLLAARPGDPPVQITDEEWSALLPCIQRPTAFSPAFIHCGEAFFRAFIDAKTSPE